MENKGYKNAPHITPKIGDIVACGLPGSTATVESISEISVDTDDLDKICVINCAMDGRMHLNAPSMAVLIKSVDGFIPE